MFGIVLLEPEIPPNTGNIIRLCANVGASLHLIKPLGFTLDDKQLRRAGLDYHEWAEIKVYANIEEFQQLAPYSRLFACTTRSQQSYTQPRYRPNDMFLLGPETRGLPIDLLTTFPPEQTIRIPMQPNIRSLNLSNAAAVILYEAWRQNDFQIC